MSTTASDKATTPSWSAILATAFDRESSYLWGLGYRLTGSAALAEDLVQETFIRALRRPPKDRKAPLRPWLRRVATNLGIDALRRRKRRPYDGPWLPDPIDTAQLSDPGADVESASIHREGLTLGFVALLEVLSPQQRAVVVLRDVLGLSGAETAAALEVGANNVKVAHHRAKERLARATIEAPDALRVDHHRQRLGELFAAIAAGDEDRVLALLDTDVRVVSDGGGVVRAARRVVIGAGDVSRLLIGLARKGAPPVGISLREINCLPAFDITYAPGHARAARRAIVQGVLDIAGQRFVRLDMVLSPHKVMAVERAPWLRSLTRPPALVD